MIRDPMATAAALGLCGLIAAPVFAASTGWQCARFELSDPAAASWRYFVTFRQLHYFLNR